MTKRRMGEKRRRSRGDPKTKQKIERRGVISWTAFKILYPGPYVGRFLAASDIKIKLMIILRVSYCHLIPLCMHLPPFPILSLTIYLVEIQLLHHCDLVNVKYPYYT